MNEPERIACFHLNQVGDLLFSLPALYNLRQRFPNAHIASVMRPGCRELLQLTDLVDEIIERPRPRTLHFRVASLLRRKRFDMAVVFSTSLGMSSLAWMSGCRQRVGFRKMPASIFLTKRVPWTEPPSTKNNLGLVEAIGCPLVKDDYVGLIRPREVDVVEADALLASVGIRPDEQFAVLGPGTSTGREIKRWSNEGFADVADRLAATFGIKSVVVGLTGGEEIRRLSSNTVDLTGNTSLPVLAALLKRAGLFVGVDSGVMHLAAAMGVRVVGLFGPSDPEITGPQGDGHAVVCVDLPCGPCLAKSCNMDRACMTGITPDMVLRAAAPLMAADPG